MTTIWWLHFSSITHFKCKLCQFATVSLQPVRWNITNGTHLLDHVDFIPKSSIVLTPHNRTHACFTLVSQQQPRSCFPTDVESSCNAAYSTPNLTDKPPCSSRHLLRQCYRHSCGKERSELPLVKLARLYVLTTRKLCKSLADHYDFTPFFSLCALGKQKTRASIEFEPIWF